MKPKGASHHLRRVWALWDGQGNVHSYFSIFGQFFPRFLVDKNKQNK